jgi:hypothetical protein
MYTSLLNKGRTLNRIIIILGLAGLIAGSFYYFFPRKKLQVSEIKKEPTLTKRGSPKVYLSSNRLEQGDTLFIKVINQSEKIKPTGKFIDKRINFVRSKTNKEWWAIIGIGPKMKPGLYNLIINSPQGDKLERQINIIKREFPITELLVTEELKERGYVKILFIPSKRLKM